MRYVRFASALICLGLLAAGCEMFNGGGDDGTDRDGQGMKAEGADGKTAVAQLKPSKAATTQPSLNNVTGTVTLTEMSGQRVKVVATLKGLTPNTKHGFHIHESGDLSAPDLSSAGGHFNPTGHSHAGPQQPQRHVGDLGNLASDAQGNAKLEIIVENATLEGENALVGKSVLVHAGEDDLRTDPAGNSGARVAGGVIEMKK